MKKLLASLMVILMVGFTWKVFADSMSTCDDVPDVGFCSGFDGYYYFPGGTGVYCFAGTEIVGYGTGIASCSGDVNGTFAYANVQGYGYDYDGEKWVYDMVEDDGFCCAAYAQGQNGSHSDCWAEWQ